MSNTESNYREIITKAVCGKGRKFTEETHTISPSHKPSSILGCWIINHKYSAEKDGDHVEVDGSYDINVWLSYDKNTKTDVTTQTVTYADVIALSTKDVNVLSDEMDVIARVIQQPNTLEATISEQGDEVNVQVEREFIVECIGETKVSVAVNPDGVLEEIEIEVEEEVEEEEEYEEEKVTDEEYGRLNPNYQQGNMNI